MARNLVSPADRFGPGQIVASGDGLTRTGAPPGPPAGHPATTRSAQRALPTAPSRQHTGAPPASPDPEAVGLFVRFVTWAIVDSYLLVALVMTVSALRAHSTGAPVLGSSVGRLWAMAFGTGVVGVGLLIMQSLGQPGGKKGIFRPIIGSDNRFSTSLAQLGIWTLAAGTAFAFLLGRAMFEGEPLETVLPGGTWDDYLILLGGPFAAAVLAKGLVSYKLDAGTLQKSESPRPELSQITTNDQGSLDLVDNQYLLFNVIALGYFVVVVGKSATLPTIPPTLLAMTSGTAALYVANKAAQRNTPLITTVTPSSAAPGDLVTVLGANFDPADRRDVERRITLTISGVERTIYSHDSSDTRFVFQVPSVAPPGMQTLKITSSAGVETEPHDLEILSRDVVITGSRPSDLRPGCKMQLYGRNMRTDLQPRVEVAGLLVSGNIAVTGNGTALTFDAPNVLPDPTEKAVLVTVSFEGRGAASLTIAVDQPRVRSAWRTQDPHKLLVSAVGLRGDDSQAFMPTVLINGTDAPIISGLNAEQNAPLEVTIPQGMAAGELRIQVIDDLGRKSSVYLLGKPPEG